MAGEPLKFYFDFYCPYCYIGWELLLKARATQPFEYQLFGVGANPPSKGFSLGREIWSDFRWDTIRKKGEAIGLTIKKPVAKEYSLLPLRALHLYQGIGLEEYVSGVFRGLFKHGIDIGSGSALKELLQAEGIDNLPLTEALSDPKTLALAEKNTLLWGHERIRLIPYLICGDERLSGSIDPRGLDNFLTLVV